MINSKKSAGVYVSKSFGFHKLIEGYFLMRKDRGFKILKERSKFSNDYYFRWATSPTMINYET